MIRAMAIGAMMMALAATASPAADTHGVTDWVRAGKVRLALFLPQYSEDPASHEITGIGTGYIGIDMMRALAKQLRIEAQVVGLSTSADVVNCLMSGACDVAFREIEPARAAQLAVTPPAFRSGPSDVSASRPKKATTPEWNFSKSSSRTPSATASFSAPSRSPRPA